MPTLVLPIKDSMYLISEFNTVHAQLTKPNVGHNAEFWSKLMQTRNMPLSGRHCWLWGSWKPLHSKLPLQKYHKTICYVTVESKAEHLKEFRSMLWLPFHFPLQFYHTLACTCIYKTLSTAVPQRVAAWAKLHRDCRGPVWNKSEPSAHTGKWNEMAPTAPLQLACIELDGDFKWMDGVEKRADLNFTMCNPFIRSILRWV